MSIGSKLSRPLILGSKGYMRQAILALLKIESRKELLPNGPPDNIASPTSEMFYIKWAETEKSQFNKIAARIVTNQVLASWPNLCSEDERDTIFDMATKHIGYLRKLYVRQRLPKGNEAETTRLLRCSADTRKCTVTLPQFTYSDCFLIH